MVAEMYSPQTGTLYLLAVLVLISGCSALGIGNGRSLRVVNERQIDILVLAVSSERAKRMDPQPEWSMSELPDGPILIQSGASEVLNPEAILGYDIHVGITIFVYNVTDEVARLSNVIDYPRHHLIANDYEIEIQNI